ncbi:MAG TPA: LysR family transcriptional regulator [Vicinamibacteria bacterium]|jgi:DNA-binding transcriptional LysR family regulator|nr:LysR family transcriptional regulator [Vicinamibacteria bacterium]
MPQNELSVLAAFAVVADERSFTKAAVRLGVSTSAISHSIRGLEEPLRVRLFARTTRTVAPTEAGQRLLAQLEPTLGDIEAALTEVGRLRNEPAGTIRFIAPAVAASMTIMPHLARFTRKYPDVMLDVVTQDDSRHDLVAARFGAGIHLGEFLQKDMVAVRVSHEQRTAIVGAPSYSSPTAQDRKDFSPW